MMPPEYKTPAEFWDACNLHDWSYHDHPDQRNYSQMEAAQRILRQVSVSHGQVAVEIYNSFMAHCGSVGKDGRPMGLVTPRPEDSLPWPPPINHREE